MAILGSEARPDGPGLTGDFVFRPDPAKLTLPGPVRPTFGHFRGRPGSTDRPDHWATARRSRRFARDRGGTLGWTLGWLAGSPLPRGAAPKIRSPLPLSLIHI